MTTTYWMSRCWSSSRANGNRGLGWDLLPPGNKSYTFEGKLYAGNKHTPDSWVEGEPKKDVKWFAGKPYDHPRPGEEDRRSPAMVGDAKTDKKFDGSVTAVDKSEPVADVSPTNQGVHSNRNAETDMGTVLPPRSGAGRVTQGEKK